ncbi:MAG: hypothetical protein KAW12_25830 [Candidatus Aminicenantes bacterium]|nr:hypothetical protein [Candidatus Aminicenantes bacterium]
MSASETPKWLLETQNKSWEPEILISGITLTFIFILSNHIYNFYGMLVQDFAVWDAVARTLYKVSIIILTGLKIILIFHLILRGLWTGFVGLSYVFPEGVNRLNLSKSAKKIHYDKPETFVIKIEKICSLLFSFIFSSFIFVLGFFLLFIPIVILFVLGLDISYIRIINLYVVLPLIVILTLLAILLETKFQKTTILNKLDILLTIYYTNIGKIKTNLIFLSYFLIIFLLSSGDISKFDFKNKKSSEISTRGGIVHLNKKFYEASRDQKLRIPKAAIDRFRVTDNAIELFIGFYKEDMYTIKKLKNNPEFLKKFEIKADKAGMYLHDLYKIVVDDKIIPGLKWYSTDHKHTNQAGIITKIPLDTLTNGYHELKINKVYWSTNKKKMKLIDNWEIIPFEIENK